MLYFFNKNFQAAETVSRVRPARKKKIKKIKKKLFFVKKCIIFIRC